MKDTHNDHKCNSLIEMPSETEFLETILKMTAETKGVNARVEQINGSVHAAIDSGHAGGITFTQDPKRSLIISGAAHSYIIGGNYRIIDELAKAGISSQNVEAGPEKDHNEVRFTIEYLHIERAVDALYTAYKSLEHREI